jgi:transcriptional regulator with XRE-family HTH domain
VYADPWLGCKSMPRRRTRSPEGQRFGDNLRRLRGERGLSQEALAEAASLTADYLGFIERGDNVPTLTVILKLAKALGVDAGELLAEFTLPTLKRMKL